MLKHVAAVLGLLVMAGAAQAQGAAARMSPEDSYRQVSLRVAPRIHMLHQGEPFQIGPVGNVAVIEQSDGLVLVDSGASYGSGMRVVDLVRTISPKPVKAVIITHWHNDHPLGVSAILKTWPQAEVIATEGTKAQMLAGKLKGVPAAPEKEWEKRRLAQLQSYIDTDAPNATDPAQSQQARTEWARQAPILELCKLDTPGTYMVLPTVTFEDRYSLDDKDAPVEVMFFGPANTKGDAVVWLPKQKVVAAGDIVVSPIPFALGGYPKSWIEGLKRLKALKFKVLIPGHGMPQTDAGFVDKLIALITEARSKAAAIAGETLTDEAVLARIDLSEQRKVFAGGDAWLGYWFDQYTAPIIVAAYHEARGDPNDA